MLFPLLGPHLTYPFQMEIIKLVIGITPTCWRVRFVCLPWHPPFSLSHSLLLVTSTTVSVPLPMPSASAPSSGSTIPTTGVLVPETSPTPTWMPTTRPSSKALKTAHLAPYALVFSTQHHVSDTPLRVVPSCLPTSSTTLPCPRRSSFTTSSSPPSSTSFPWVSPQTLPSPTSRPTTLSPTLHNVRSLSCHVATPLTRSSLDIAGTTTLSGGGAASPTGSSGQSSSSGTHGSNSASHSYGALGGLAVSAAFVGSMLRLLM